MWWCCGHQVEPEPDDETEEKKEDKEKRLEAAKAQETEDFQHQFVGECAIVCTSFAFSAFRCVSTELVARVVHLCRPLTTACIAITAQTKEMACRYRLDRVDPSLQLRAAISAGPFR